MRNNGIAAVSHIHDRIILTITNRGYETNWLVGRLTTTLEAHAENVRSFEPYGVFDEQYGFFQLADAIALATVMQI